MLDKLNDWVYGRCMKVRWDIVTLTVGLILVAIIVVGYSSSQLANENASKPAQSTPAPTTPAPISTPAPVETPTPTPQPVAPVQTNSGSYSYGSGHSAGYDWGEQNDICDTDYDNGNSDSFNEGVREYAEENC